MAKPRIGEILVRQGKLAPERLAKALELQAIVGGRLGTALLDMGAVDEEVLLVSLGEQRSSKPVAAADLHAAHPVVIKMIRKKLAARYRIVPFDLRGKTLFLASTDPVDPFLEDEIGMLTSCMVRSCVALELRIFEALEILYDIPMPTRYGTLVRRLAAGPPSPPEIGRAAAGDVALAEGSPTPKAELPAPVVSKAPPPELPNFIELDAEDAAMLESAPGPSADLDPNRSEAFRWLKEKSDPRDEIATGSPEAVEQAPATSATGGPAAVEEVGDGPSTASIEERLADAARELQHAEIRDEIGDVLLDFCAPYFERRMLLIRRSDRILGWRGGEDTSPEMVRAIEIGTDEASVFLSASNFWLGPLPPLPANENLVLAFGGGRPKDCVVVPITLKSKIVCYLYGDNGDHGVGGAPIAELKRLAAKAAIAFEVLIYKNKIRMI
ncbi:MAG: hypothetical protein V3T72_05770 [Thermoanaerobaculia bacterium]